jgi:hypothetical protein
MITKVVNRLFDRLVHGHTRGPAGAVLLTRTAAGRRRARGSSRSASMGRNRVKDKGRACRVILGRRQQQSGRWYSGVRAIAPDDHSHAGDEQVAAEAAGDRRPGTPSAAPATASGRLDDHRPINRRLRADNNHTAERRQRSTSVRRRSSDLSTLAARRLAGPRRGSVRAASERGARGARGRSRGGASRLRSSRVARLRGLRREPPNARAAAAFRRSRISVRRGPPALRDSFER